MDKESKDDLIFVVVRFVDSQRFFAIDYLPQVGEMITINRSRVRVVSVNGFVVVVSSKL